MSALDIDGRTTIGVIKTYHKLNLCCKSQHMSHGIDLTFVLEMNDILLCHRPFETYSMLLAVLLGSKQSPGQLSRCLVMESNFRSDTFNFYSV